MRGVYSTVSSPIGAALFLCTFFGTFIVVCCLSKKTYIKEKLYEIRELFNKKSDEHDCAKTNVSSGISKKFRLA